MAELPNFLRIVLVTLSVISFYPQFRKIVHRGDCLGISPTYVFLNLVAATDQFGLSLMMIIDNREMADTIVKSPPSSGNWINLVQFAIVWFCYLVFFVLVLYFSNLNRLAKVMMVITYLAIVAFEFWSSVEMARVREGGTDVEKGFIGLLSAVRVLLCTPIATALIAAALALQLRQMRTTAGIEALSIESLGLQGTVFLMLAFCWPLRMWLPPGERLVPWFTAWYQFVGWATVDSLIYAVSQGFLWWLARQFDEKSRGRESEPLL